MDFSERPYINKVIAKALGREDSKADISGSIPTSHFNKLDSNGTIQRVGRKRYLGEDASGNPIFQKIKDDIQFKGRCYQGDGSAYIDVSSFVTGTLTAISKYYKVLGGSWTTEYALTSEIDDTNKRITIADGERMAHLEIYENDILVAEYSGCEFLDLAPNLYDILTTNGNNAILVNGIAADFYVEDSEISYSHLNQKGYNTYFKPPANGDAYTIENFNNLINHSIVLEFLAFETNSGLGASIFSLGNTTTVTIVTYKSNTSKISIITNGSNSYECPILIPKGQTICMSINIKSNPSFLYEISINGSEAIVISPTKVSGSGLNKVVVGSNTQQESGFFEPTVPTKKVELYDVSFSLAELQELSNVGQKENPLNSPSLVFSKYYNSTDIVVPASITTPNENPLEYKGTLAPRLQIVDNPCLVLNGVDQKIQFDYEPTNIKINGVDVTGDWTITDIGGGNWSIEPSVETQVYNLLINDTYSYPCSEGNVTIAYDVSGNGNHGTAVNAVLPDIWGTQDVFAYNFYEGYWSYKDVSNNEVKLPVDAGASVVIDSVTYNRQGFVKGFKETGKWNGVGKLQFADIPENPEEVRGLSFTLEELLALDSVECKYDGIYVSNILILEIPLSATQIERENFHIIP